MSYAYVMDLTGLSRMIHRRHQLTDHLVVGISGYGGSGKTTLAQQLARALPRAFWLRGDDFLDPTRSHQRSVDWNGVERDRLRDEVLLPYHRKQPIVFRRHNWETGKLGRPETLPPTEILIVDLIGLFHPEALPWIDLTIWCDVPLDVASDRGRERDRRLGLDHDYLWTEVWIPNEIAFEQHFSPRCAADVRYHGDDCNSEAFFSFCTSDA